MRGAWARARGRDVRADGFLIPARSNNIGSGTRNKVTESTSAEPSSCAFLRAWRGGQRVRADTPLHSGRDLCDDWRISVTFGRDDQSIEIGRPS